MPRFGELCVDRCGISEADVAKALSYQERYGGRIGSILVNMGLLTEDQLAELLAEQLGLRFVDQFDPSALEEVSLEPPPESVNVSFLKENGYLWVGRSPEGDAVVLTYDPLVLEVYEHLSEGVGSFRIWVCTRGGFDDAAQALAEVLGEGKAHDLRPGEWNEDEVERLRELASEAPIVRAVNSLISRAVQERASDIHLEPSREVVRVRFRVDGVLRTLEYLPKSMQLPVTSRIKVLAGMDIAERRIPQDGKIATMLGGRSVDIRVSTLPSVHGETVVLRLLGRDDAMLRLDALGFRGDLCDSLRRDVAQTGGLVLVTGPTGSGKSTTLYALLREVPKEQVKVVTIEDPVEYQMDGVTQVQVRPDLGYDFGDVVRSVLRQDPDVILVGEIRDRTTARTVLQAAVTGHLVLSTVHTTDAASAYVRLVDLGAESYMVDAALLSVLAQRLLRRLCDCAVPCGNDPKGWAGLPLDRWAAELGLDPAGVRVPAGCERCGGTGYAGRFAIGEYLPYGEELRSMEKGPGFADGVRRWMVGRGLPTLAREGVARVLEGRTSAAELARVLGDVIDRG